MLKIEFKAMGCHMAAFLDSDRPGALQALKVVPAWFEEWEQALSRFRPDSELSRLNAAAGAPVAVGPVLWAVLQSALEAAAWTDGLVVPTVLDSLERAGYDRSFDLLHAGNPAGPSAALEARGQEHPSAPADWRKILLDRRRQTVRLPPGARLDLGGIAKGWAAQQAMQRLREFGPALVNASGDIAVSGLQADGAPWPVDIADPLKVQANLGLLLLPDCGVATSGIDYRRWLSGNSWKHHIIDPRSGEPAETDLMSVSVVAPDALRAEAAAKVVLILGSQAGLDWLEERAPLCGLLALQDGRLLYSRGVQDYLWSEYVA